MTTPARFITQITQVNNILFALCNDFTVWTFNGTTWTQIAAIPMP